MLNSWLPSMNHSTNSSTFNKKLAASQLAKKNQNCRDLWIRKLYGLVHQLNASSETVVNTENLDNTKNAPALDDRVLGYKNHRSRYEAYFPEYSYTDGKPFVFKYKKGSKKSKEQRSDFEWCKKTCLSAEAEDIEMFNRVLRSCINLEVRDARTFIQKADACPNTNTTTRLYKLVIGKFGKRNHPKICYQNDDQNFKGEITVCNSDLRKVRKLSVHYKNVRSIYHLMNSLKVADQFISDIDTATALGDLEYLLKLLTYIPHYSPKTFELERSSVVINETTMAEKFGKHYAKFLETVTSLPSVPCISCNELKRPDPKVSKIITEN